MTRRQVGALGGLIVVIALMMASMSAAVVPEPPQSAIQSIADPFCATSDDRVELSEVTLVKRGTDVSVLWRFGKKLPPRLVLRLDMMTDDSKYHWMILAELDGPHVARVETIDTVSNQRVGYDSSGTATASRVSGDQVEITAPLPGSPDAFNWFAGAGRLPSEVTDLQVASLTAFCPAGWLASYPSPQT